MKKFLLHLVMAMVLTTTALTASGQKTAYGYTMMPSTAPTMISFNIDDPSTTTPMGNYGNAEPRSGAAAKGILYMMGIDDDFNTWFYSMDLATGESETIKKLGEITIPADMSYDYSTSTMYSVANSETVDGVSALSSVNLENGNITTVVDDLGYSCKAIAIDARGQLYALTNNGMLLKVNKSNGENVVIGNTGISLASWWNFQSMEFDRKTGVLYLAAWGRDEKTTLYTIDVATGAATRVGTIGDGTHTVALSIPYEPSSGNAPDGVSDLTLSADPNGELSATLSWVNPVTDYSGAPLEGTVSIRITHPASGQNTTFVGYHPGEAMQTQFQVENAGMHEFIVFAFNEAGCSLEQSIEGWIGHDSPAAVGNATAKLNRNQLLVNDLSWEAPTTGAHGGYLHTASLKYDIVRKNDGKIIAQDLTETHISDEDLLEELTRYTYQIVAKNDDGMGESATTNDLVNGPAIECPYTAPFNSWEESGQYWTILDANGDGYPFVWYKDFMNMFGQGGDKCFFIYQKNDVLYAYDFIISPPLEFQEGHEYRITANVSNDDIAGYREEKFRFYTMSGYDLTGALPLGDEAFTVKHPGEFRDYSYTFKVEDDGYGTANEIFVSFIALCCCSQYDMGMLLVNSITFEDLTPVTLTGDVNGDGEVNIADVNAIIDMILAGASNSKADVNHDNEVNIADVNTIIDMILNM